MHNGTIHNGESAKTVLTQLVAADGTTLGFVQDSEVSTFARTYLDDTTDTATLATLGIVASTYTPTLTNVANVDASTAYALQYIRVGNVITVSGKIDVDPTAGATLTQVGITLPVASDLAQAYQCAGIVASPGTNGYGWIRGDATNNRAEAFFVPGATSNQEFYFHFTYRVI